jgi:hypothetical protein
MNMFDMELYEYVKRAYQAQAEEIFDVVGYELPAPVVDTAAAASMIGNVARPKSMNEQSIVGTSSRPGNGMEINASDEDHVSAGGGDMGNTMANSHFDVLGGSHKSLTVNAVKSMTEDSGMDVVKRMVVFKEKEGLESEISGAGTKVMGNAVVVEPSALRMADVLDAESESTPTAKIKMTHVDGH